MGRKSGPKAEDVACVAVEAKPPKRKAEQVIEEEEEGGMKKKQKKTAAKEVEIKNQEVEVVKKAVLAAKKKDKIWAESSSDDEDAFEESSSDSFSDSDSDSDVTEESNDVTVYIRDGCFEGFHLFYLKAQLRTHLSSCGDITRITLYANPMIPESKACITFSTKQAVERALNFDQSQLLDGTPITVVQGSDSDYDYDYDYD